MNALVRQIIELVGELPIEWQPKWHELVTADLLTKSTFREH